jgi:hypothetical protein
VASTRRPSLRLTLRTLTPAVLVVLIGSLGLAPSNAASASPKPSPSPPATPGASAANAATNATFGLGPASKGKVDRRNGYSFLQAKGTVLSDEVAVINLGTAPLTLNVYAADAVNGPDGTLGLQPGAKQPVDSAAWVTFTTPSGKGYVVVPGRTVKGPSTVIVPFTVHVPKNAEVGDHLAGIVASLVTQGQTPGDRSANVKLEQRIAIRMATRIAGVLKAELQVEKLTASYQGSLSPVGKGTAVLTYTVRNTGNVRLGGRQSINIHGLVGPSASPQQADDIPLLLPGYTADVTVTVPGVAPFVYETADVSIAALAAVGDANPVANVATVSTHFWAVPWTLLALLLLLGLIGGWWWRRRSSIPPEPQGRRSRSSSGSGPQEYNLVGSASSGPSQEIPS